MKFTYPNRLILLLLFLKLTYVLVNCISPEFFTRMRYEGRPIEYLLQIFSNHDSGWYERISNEGYPFPIQIPSENNACFAFFPSYPLTGWLFSHFFQISSRLTLFLLSSIFSLMLPVVFYKLLVELKYSQELAYTASLLMMIFPHSFYFSMIYTESMFVTFGLLSFYFFLKEEWIGFALSAMVFSLTRIHAICWILPFYMLAARKFGYINYRSVLSLLPFFLPILAYLSIFKFTTGNFFFFKSMSELYWNGKPMGPFMGIYNSFVYGFNGHGYLLYNILYALIMLMISLTFARKLETLPWFILIATTILLPLYEGSAASQPRFISTAFPLFVLFGEAFLKLENQRIRSIVMGLIFLLHLVSFVFWNISDPLNFLFLNPLIDYNKTAEAAILSLIHISCFK